MKLYFARLIVHCPRVRKGQAESQGLIYDTMISLKGLHAFAVKSPNEYITADTFHPSSTLLSTTLDRAEKQTLSPLRSIVLTPGESTPYFA